MKIVIKETYGGIKTYINQIYLHEDIPEPEQKKSANDSRKTLSSNSHNFIPKSQVAKDLKKELSQEEKREDDEEENQKHLMTDSEDSLHNSPQKLCNIQDISRISKEPKPLLKKEV